MGIVIKSMVPKGTPTAELSLNPVDLPTQKKKIVIGDDNLNVANLNQDDDPEEDEELNNLTKLLAETPDSIAVIDYIIRELADETGSLKSERKARKDSNISYAQISARRVDALKKMGDLWLKRLDLNKKQALDIKSSEFQFVLKSLLDKIKESMMESGFSREQRQVFFTKFSENLKAWEEEISRILSTKDADTNNAPSPTVDDIDSPADEDESEDESKVDI